MKDLPKSCDYLVIGSGAAGAVMAARLSENLNVSVVLLEAGPKDQSVLSRLPGLGFAVGAHPKFNWGFVTEPVPSMDGRNLVFLQGKMIGGSSSINGMIYTRGHLREYDIWRQMGCEGWASEDVLPYFKRSEGNERGEGPWHGGGGPVKVRPARPELPICTAFLEAAEAAGYPVLDDLNRDTVDGFGYYDINVRRGRRMSSARSYLGPSAGRSTLTVIPYAMALRLRFDEGRACGADVSVRGQVRPIEVEREIIVSCGAVKSPQLLMLSGIGPADQLHAHGIPVLHDSPKVGQGLQNHVCCVCLFRIRDLLPQQHGFGMTIYQGSPHSRGAVTLRSADPTDAPKIDPGYFADPRDMQVLLKAVGMMREMIRQPPIARYIEREVTPGDHVQSEDALMADIRRNGATAYHQCGTCAMGPDEDAVLDQELRVRGVKGLRVVDTSIMPRIPNAALHAPTLMIGEKAAALVRESYPNC